MKPPKMMYHLWV